jgi:ATP-binding cassette, subfamily B, bacterial
MTTTSTTTTTAAQETRFEKRFDLRVWSKLLRYAMGHKWKLAGLAFFGFTTALSDIGFPWVTGALIDEVAIKGSEADISGYAWVYFGLVCSLSISILAFIMLAGSVRTSVAHDIRRDGFANLQRLSFSYFDKHPVGWLMSRMTSDCERLSNIMAWGTLDLVWGSTLLIGIAAVMISMNWSLALIVLTVMPVLAVVSAMFQTRILGSARAVRKNNSRITAAYNEGIMGMRTTKVFGREDDNLEDFNKLTDEMFQASVRNQVQSALFFPIVLSLGSLATGLALAAGGMEVLVGGLSIGVLITFIQYTRRFFDPIEDMSHWFAELQMAQASAERIFGLIETVPEIRDSEELCEQLAKEAREAREATERSDEHTVLLPARRAAVREIRFENVDFAYSKGPLVLEGFDLDVKQGESIALVGATGGGKSTIVNLLCRFYEPTGGRILMDGKDYRTLPLHWLQSQLGIVLQTPHLFSGNIADNIRYGNLDATQEDIEAAATLVGAHEFILEFKDGYKTEVGEGGNQLSTGQKQLLSFARAIIGDPQILVMDEATSSIDTETEARIQHGVEQVLNGRTSFVIAHRLSTIQRADRILVIDGGHIVEQGNHKSLLAQTGRYYELYSQQRLRESVGP